MHIRVRLDQVCKNAEALVLVAAKMAFILSDDFAFSIRWRDSEGMARARDYLQDS